MKKNIYIPCLTALLVASVAQAQFFVYDGFETPGDYSDGTDIATQSPSGGSGDWVSDWSYRNEDATIKVNTGVSSLVYGDGSSNSLTTASGSISQATSSNTILQRHFNDTAFAAEFDNPSNELWFSMLVNVASDSSVFFRAASNVVPDSTDVSGIGPGFDLVGGSLQASFKGTTSAGTQTLTVGETYFILGRVKQDAGTGGNDVLDVWVNSALDVAPSTMAGSGDLSVEKSFVLSGSVGVYLQSKNSSSLNVDELRIGTTFDSVTPYTAVPEAGTFALLAGLFALGGVALRRRA